MASFFSGLFPKRTNSGSTPNSTPVRNRPPSATPGKPVRATSPIMQALANADSRHREAGSKFKQGRTGKADPAFREVLALTGKEEKAVCVRCKYDIEICPSLRTCIFDSNVFIAGKELPCRCSRRSSASSW